MYWEEFANIVGISAEELLIDQYYWFEKSTKQKGILMEYLQFCNQEYGKILTGDLWLSWLSIGLVYRKEVVSSTLAGPTIRVLK